MDEYRVNLDIYNGPLDLLLYLIRRDEVDICDIPISRITEQYVKYVDMIQRLDPNLAGDFLVLAATLIEIKTRMLLPSPPPEEGGQTTLEIDPRAELVRQLLEYKAFKDAAGDLRQAAEVQSLKFPRAPLPLSDEQRNAIDLEDVQVWDLLDAFSRLLASIGQQPGAHQVIYDDTPVELHAADILDRLEREGALPFSRVFEGADSRSQVIGLFLALLELVRRKKVRAIQERNFDEIHVHLNPDAPKETEPSNEPQAEAGGTWGDAQTAPPSPPAEALDHPDGAKGDDRLPAGSPDAGLGQYVPSEDTRQDEPRGPEDDDDETGRDAEATGV